MLKQYNADPLGLFPVKVLEGLLAPGTQVVHRDHPDSSFGMVIALEDYKITILWSQAPPETFMVRRVWPSMIRSDIVSIQPMSLPSAQIFYLYGKETRWQRLKRAVRRFILSMSSRTRSMVSAMWAKLRT
jgi:hypothetical protein